MEEEAKKPWYNEGLRFSCTGCSGCCSCRGRPSFVWLSEEDITLLCETMNLSKEEFVNCYTRTIFGRLVLKQSSENYSCIFLKNKKQCSVHMTRPKQCRTFPFWPNYLKDPTSWAKAATR